MSCFLLFLGYLWFYISSALKRDINMNIATSVILIYCSKYEKGFNPGPNKVCGGQPLKNLK